MIVNTQIISQFRQIQIDTYKYVKSVNLPLAWIGRGVGKTRQTIRRKFEEQSFTVQEFEQVAKFINDKKI